MRKARRLAVAGVMGVVFWFVALWAMLALGAFAPGCVLRPLAVVTLGQSAEAIRAGEGIMHQYGLAVLGLIICVVLLIVFVWGGLKVVVPVANALAAWSGSNAAAAASIAQAAGSNERIADKLEGLLAEVKNLYAMIQHDRKDELIEMGKRGERAVRHD